MHCSIAKTSGSTGCFYQTPAEHNCTCSLVLTATGSGGSGGYTYTWTKYSGYGNVSPNGDQCGVTYTGSSLDDGRQCAVQCKATDSGGRSMTQTYIITWSIASNQ